MYPSTIDAELCMTHNKSQTQARLVSLLAKHVDDLKITGEPAEIQHIIAELERVFGKLKLNWNSFTNCGVRHIQDAKNKRNYPRPE